MAFKNNYKDSHFVETVTKALKGLRIAKIKIVFFKAPAQRHCMQPILVSYEAPFRSNLPKKNLSLTGPTKKYKYSFLLCAVPLTKMTR